MSLTKKSGQPIKIIAGPCSAETEEQVMATAAALLACKDITLFRAGIWKPRTRPGSFEGVGTVGLKWLQQVSAEYGLKCTTEVASAKHVEETLNHGLETLWIGARTTANPFAMAEIAAAVKGAPIHIMIKNPIGPDIELWIGAVERIANVEVSSISLIHRGFTTTEKSVYRNAPLWDMAMDMKTRFPDMAMICDPSHIAGDKGLIQGIALHALNAGFDGLMIESHINPAEAWSDKKQQLTPQELITLLSLLHSQPAKELNESLLPLREIVDMIDNHIIDLLMERMQVVDNIGQVKLVYKEEAYQEARWQSILRRLMENGKNKGLSQELIRNVFTAIHADAVNKQVAIQNHNLI